MAFPFTFADLQASVIGKVNLELAEWAAGFPEALARLDSDASAN